mgnify:FL=1
MAKDFCDAMIQSSGDESSLDSRFDSYRWVLRSKFLDEMCTDFMAPIMRGVLTPTVPRGDALLRFWEQRFGWAHNSDRTGFAGEAESPYDAARHPLVFFNATDTLSGSRLIVAFPPLDEAILRNDHGDPSRPPPRALSNRVYGQDLTVSL